MNLVQLYGQTPVEKHNRIIVRQDNVYLIDDDGLASLAYLIVNDELIPVYAETSMKQDIKAIKKKVGA